MELGEKLKQARLDAGLSQRQLCGDAITRNMLSLIENGTAKPSMDTLRYLAQRLGKPVSWFLGEVPARPSGLSQGWAALLAGDPRQAMAYLPQPSEGEAVFLLTLAQLALAEEALAQCRLPYARELLEQAKPGCDTTPVLRPELQRKRLLLLYQVSPEHACDLCGQLDDDGELLLRAASALQSGDPARCAALLDSASHQTAEHWLSLRADACFAMGQYIEAVEYYQRIEDRSLRQLEQCYEKLGDYKMAYHYACRQRKS